MKNFFTSFGIIIGAGIIAFLVLFGVSFILAFPVMWLWNWVIVDIFQLPEIGYWKAFGIYILFGLLFKNINMEKKD